MSDRDDILRRFSLSSGGTRDPVTPDLGRGGTPESAVREEAWGSDIVLSAGDVRLNGKIIWVNENKLYILNDTDPVRYMATFAVSFGYTMTPEINRRVFAIHADGIRVFSSEIGRKRARMYIPGRPDWGGSAWYFYPGSETQGQDHQIVLDKGESRTPAFRGQMIMVIRTIPLLDFGNKIPSITATIKEVGNDYEGITLRSIIRRLSKAAKAPYREDVDFIYENGVEDLHANGIILNDPLQFRDALSSLARFYGFDFIERARRIVFKKYLGSDGSFDVNWELDADNLVRPGKSPYITVQKRPEQEIASTVEVEYIDTTQQFRENVQRARRPAWPKRSIDSERVDKFRVPLVVDAVSASRAAAGAMFRDAQQENEVRFKLPFRYLRLEPGDIEQITVAGVSYIVKCTKVTIEIDLTISVEGVSLAQSPAEPMFTYEGESAEIGVPGPLFYGPWETDWETGASAGYVGNKTGLTLHTKLVDLGYTGNWAVDFNWPYVDTIPGGSQPGFDVGSGPDGTVPVDTVQYVNDSFGVASDWQTAERRYNPVFALTADGRAVTADAAFGAAMTPMTTNTHTWVGFDGGGGTVQNGHIWRGFVNPVRHFYTKPLMEFYPAGSKLFMNELYQDDPGTDEDRILGTIGDPAIDEAGNGVLLTLADLVDAINTHRYLYFGQKEEPMERFVSWIEDGHFVMMSKKSDGMGVHDAFFSVVAPDGGYPAFAITHGATEMNGYAYDNGTSESGWKSWSVAVFFNGKFPTKEIAGLVWGPPPGGTVLSEPMPPATPVETGTLDLFLHRPLSAYGIEDAIGLPDDADPYDNDIVIEVGGETFTVGKLSDDMTLGQLFELYHRESGQAALALRDADGFSAPWGKLSIYPMESVGSPRPVRILLGTEYEVTNFFLNGSDPVAWTLSPRVVVHDGDVVTHAAANVVHNPE